MHVRIHARFPGPTHLWYVRCSAKRQLLLSRLFPPKLPLAIQLNIVALPNTPFATPRYQHLVSSTWESRAACLHLCYRSWHLATWLCVHVCICATPVQAAALLYWGERLHL